MHNTKLNAANQAACCCPVCDRTVPRLARQQRYCSTRCRVKAHRGKTPAGALQRQPRYPTSGGVTNPHKSANKNNDLQRAETGSSLFFNGPLNLLGGGAFRWPAAGPLDAATTSKIQRSEIAAVVMMPPVDDGWIDWPPSEVAS